MHVLLIAYQLNTDYKNGTKMLQQVETDHHLFRKALQIDLHIRLHRYLMSNQYRRA